MRLFRFVFVAALSVAAHADPAANTFVFLINGAEDHSVLRSRTSSEMVRADEWDAEKITVLAQTCNDCNVVLLHVRSQKAANLQMFSRGKLIASRQVCEISHADAHALSELLKSAERVFPLSRFHLVYRAHSFLDRVQELAQGLSRANLQEPLSSITFACCSMAFLEVAASVSPYAKYMIATQTNVVETQDFGFDYSFLTQIGDQQSEAEIAESIADRLLSSFRVGEHQLEQAYESAAPIMESSISLIRLEKMDILAPRFKELLKENDGAIAENCRVTKVVADRYIDFLKTKQSDVSAYLKWRWEAYPRMNDFDLICFLRALETQEAGSLIADFKEVISLRDKPRHSTKEGLSFVWSN